MIWISEQRLIAEIDMYAVFMEVIPAGLYTTISAASVAAFRTPERIHSALKLLRLSICAFEFIIPDTSRINKMVIFFIFESYLMYPLYTFASS